MIFIKFDQAIFRTNEIERAFDLEEIPRQKNFLEIKQNLFCPTQSCGAKLVFNQRSTGKIYLSKHKSYEHAEDCSHFTDEIAHVNSITEYVEVNGRISPDGIKRRKSDAMKALRDYLNPPEPKPKQPKKPSTPRKERVEDPDNVTQGIKVNYDPSGEIIKKDGADGETKIKEPPFYERFPHQISVSDSGKNLRTSILIDNVKVGSRNKNNYAEISGEFEDVKITFVLPEEFFVGSDRNLNSDQLLDYLNILKSFVESGSTKLFLTSLCQAPVLDMDDIVLYILDPDFMCFQTPAGREFSSLTNVIVAITTRVI